MHCALTEASLIPQGSRYAVPLFFVLAMPRAEREFNERQRTRGSTRCVYCFFLGRGCCCFFLPCFWHALAPSSGLQGIPAHTFLLVSSIGAPPFRGGERGCRLPSVSLASPLQRKPCVYPAKRRAYRFRANIARFVCIISISRSPPRSFAPLALV